MPKTKTLVPAALLFAALIAAAPVAGQSRDTKPAQQPTKKQPAPSNTPTKKNTDPFETPTKEPVDTGDEKGKIDLRPKFTKGAKITFKMDMDSRSKTSMPALEDAPQEQTTKYELGLIFKVKDVIDDGTIVDLTFSTVKVTQQTGKNKADKLEFDSNRPAATDKDNPLAPGCRELANTTFTLTLDKDGNVTNMAGGSGLSSLDSLGMPGAMGSLGGGLGGTGSTPSTGNSKGFADAIGAIFSVKKGSPFVKVGEKWTTSDDMDSALIGKLRITTDSIVKSYSGSQAKIKVTGKVEAPSNSGVGGMSLFQVKDTFYMGDYIWDTKAGMLKSMELDQNVTIDAGSASGGMTMTSSSKIHVNRQ